jgi:predicted metal-dependent hydrolase
MFYQRLAARSPRVEPPDIPCPSLAMRAMRTRWGSCSRSGLIMPSLRLVQTPMDYIDYVLLHALCHLKERHHGKQYDHLLDHTLPEWRERRQQLSRFELY